MHFHLSPEGGVSSINHSHISSSKAVPDIRMKPGISEYMFHCITDTLHSCSNSGLLSKHGSGGEEEEEEKREEVFAGENRALCENNIFS